MRFGPTFLAVVLIGLGAVLSTLAALSAVAAVEQASARIVAAALKRDGHDWAGVQTDGLQVILTGRAPSEAARFGARTTAARMVEGTRVIDGMDVIADTPLPPPAFKVEILRNEGGLSLIGLVPTAYDRAVLTRLLARTEANVTDLLETADHPVPPGWQDAMDYAVQMLPRLPRAKISVAPGEVRITALTDGADAKADLEAELIRRVPDTLRLALDIAAPRPVISPFTLRFLMPENGPPRFDACAADTQVARARILSAARKAGLEGQAGCTIGLGAPTADWARAVEAGIAAVADLGYGSVTFADTDVALRAPAGTSPAAFDTAAAELEAALPGIFALTAILPPSPDRTDEAVGGPSEFIATLSPEGLVQLRGRLTDALTRSAVESLARARFGAAAVYSATRLDANLPASWGPRVLAGLEGLEVLERGALIVTAQTVSLRGVTARADGQAEVVRLFSNRMGEGADFTLEITYEAPPEPVTTLPTAQECMDRIDAITATRKITFDPGSTQITGETVQIVSDIAEILKECRAVDKQIEIAGFTDSQGREEMNRTLSQARADSVLDALAARRVLTGKMTARGYGENDPIADNGTEEGREANRRIEFRLLSPAPADPEQAPPGTVPGEAGAAPAPEPRPEALEPENATRGGQLR